MNRSIQIFLLTSLCLVCAALAVHAKPPAQPQLSDYKEIIEKQPFGALKQVVVDTAPQQSDYELQGLTQMSDGWMIVIAKKQSPNEQIIIQENQKNEDGISFLEVKLDKSNYLETKASISTPTGEQLIGFNPISLVQPRTQPQPANPNPIDSKNSQADPTSESEEARPVRRVPVRRVPVQRRPIIRSDPE